jgi:hypothetical protein
VADLRRLLRETIGAPYYRTRPIEAARFTASKFAYRRAVTDPRWMLRRLEFDPDVVLAGLERWGTALDRMLDATGDGGDGNVAADIGLLQYGVIRGLRPELVIETGVAAGVSTSFIGAALIDNDAGTLVSIDLGSEVDGLVADGSRYDWSDREVGWAIPAEIRAGLGDRHRLVLEDVRTALPRILDEVGDIDCFVHDDLHTPVNMRWQYELVWPRLRTGGILMSDDLNHAWRAFGASIGRQFDAEMNVQRFGILRKP